MKQLVLIRHAKSSWKYDGLADALRPLNSRGYSEALALAEWMKEEGIYPHVFLVSPSVRTYTTAMAILLAIESPSSKVILSDALLCSGSDAYLNLLPDLDPRWNSVAIVGHNDAISETLNALSGYSSMMKPGDCAVLRSDTKNWDSFKKNTAVLERYRSACQ